MQRFASVRRGAFLCGLVMVVAATSGRAQTGGPFDLSWSTIDGGGIIEMSGGNFAMDATTGQPDAGELTGGTYVLGGGFWQGGVRAFVGVDFPADVRTLHMSPGMPNPFTSRTLIGLTLPRPQRVVLKVFDVRGALVKTLIEETLVAGRHTVEWNGRDDDGQRVARGVYLVHGQMEGYRATAKLVFLGSN